MGETPAATRRSFPQLFGDVYKRQGVVYFASLAFGRAGGLMRLRRPRQHLEG